MDPRISLLLQESLAMERAGDNVAALLKAQTALDLAQAASDREALAATLANLAQVHHRFGHYDRCRERATQALDHAGDTTARVLATMLLAVCDSEGNDLARAEHLFRQSADLARQIGDQWGLGRILHNLAFNIYLPQGQFGLALAAMEEADHWKVQAGRPDWGHAFLRSEVCLITGDREGARAALELLSRQIIPGSRVWGGYLWLAAHLAMDEDDLERARECLREARTVAERTGNPDLQVWVWAGQSRCQRLAGDAGAALAWAEEAVANARRLGYRHFEAQALIERGRAAWQKGHPEAAEADWRAAESILTPLGCAYDLTVVAFLRAALRNKERLPGAAEAWREAARRITQGGYAFLLERERDLAFPLLATQLRSPQREQRVTTRALLDRLACVPPRPLHVACLGQFEVRQGRRLIPYLAWHRRAGELLRYLLVAYRRSVARDALLEALWPDQAPERAATLFHQATSALRRALEPDLPAKFPSRYLVVEDERVTLFLPSGSTVDFELFEEQLGTAQSTNSADSLAGSLALYAGEPFPLDRYADWAQTPRRRLARSYLDGLLALARAQLAADHPLPALDSCRRLLDQDPWCEEAVLIGMQAHLALGDRSGALQMYRRLERALQQEFGIAPRTDLTELANSC